MRILISAYSCGPGQGSEAGNGWNWSAAMADLGHEVTILTTPLHRSEIAAMIRQHPQGTLSAVFVDVPGLASIVKGQIGVYAKYLAWQYAAYRRARGILKTEQYDLIHHLTWGSLQLGTWMGLLPVPLVFGPVGGGQVAPSALREFYAGNWKTEAIRSFTTEKLIMMDPFARVAARNARLVLANNRETERLARRVGAQDVRYLSELGLHPERIAEELPASSPSAFRLLWVGRLLPRKGILLALRAMAQVNADHGAHVHLTIIGDGPQAARLDGWIAELGLSGVVNFCGRIPFEAVQAAYRDHSALLFTSLRDSTGAQLLEAMAAGLPVIALKQSGASLLVGERRGLLVEIGDGDETVAAMAEQIKRLSQDQALHRQLSQAALDFARTQTWPLRASQLAAMCEEIVQRPGDRR